MNFFAYFIVFLGAGLGGALRHGVNDLVTNLTGSASTPGFPYGILTINITGSLLLGLLAGYFGLKGHASQDWRLFLTTGICGGYTTFSTFSLDAVLLWERGQPLQSVSYVAASVLVSIAALMAGLWFMRQMG
jgi:CrcB protein